MEGGGQRLFERFDTAVDGLRTRTPQAALAREAAALRREEIVASTRQSGSSLDAVEVNLLLDRGRATGGHPLVAYLLVRDYAEAARFAADRVPHRAGDPRPFFTLSDIRRLHVLAARSESAGLPGAWRDVNPTPVAGGFIPAPPWQIPAEVAAFVERFGRGPSGVPVPLWCARMLAAFTRIRPYAAANGRVARLVLGIVFARLALPPVAFTGALARRYPTALSAAAGRRPEPLALVIARAAIDGIERLRAAGDPTADYIPLAGGGAERASLYKAAQRGRLQTIARNGRLYTTQAWLDGYRGSRSRAGRPRR